MDQRDLNEAEDTEAESVSETTLSDGKEADLDAESKLPTSAPPESDSDAPLRGCSGRWDEVAETLESIREIVELQHQMRARDQNTIAELKDEVASLRRGELRDAQRPLLNSLARLCDSVDKALAEEDSDQEMLRFLREGLLDALESTGLAPVEASEGNAFVRGQHRVASRVETGDEELDLTIARLKRGGLVWPDGEIFRPAEVDVFVFVSNSSPAAGQERTD